MIVKKINGKIIRVYTNDSLKLIRVISYIEFKDKQYEVIMCNKFTENEFNIELKDKCVFNIDDEVIGVKISQPRSYLSTEPAVLRANKNNFDAVEQVWDRADTLEKCGHIPDKIEILVLGGTWSHYPKEYQYEFVRDIYYYAANTFKDFRGRNRNTLEAEIMINETAECRIIGLTLETRPDCINTREIKLLRMYNTTRVQLGIQHIDDDILYKINRGCNLSHTIRSTLLLKHNGFKIDWHLMPDLPGSSYEKDYDMFKKLLSHEKIYNHKHHIVYKLDYPELQADQLKIYPCSTVDWTEIKEWYNKGEYKPYSEDINKLIELIIFIKMNMYPWIRINRIIRDIPNMNILGGNKCVHLHDVVLNKMEKENLTSECIRCREVRNQDTDLSKAELFIREYNGLNGKEYFISFESPDNKVLYGFLRLRINFTNNDLIYEELHNCAFVRELHVYGEIVKHGTYNKKIQHQGFGKKLLKKAEELTLKNNIYKLAIISGVGVREYYEKNGYKLIKTYMIKELNYNLIIIKYTIMIIIMFLSYYKLFY